MDISLGILGVDSPEAASEDSLPLRSAYRQLARLLHPDKCGHPHAADAFAALGAAWRFASGQEHLTAEPALADMGGGGDPGDPTTALMPLVSFQHLPIWTTNRLVVQAWVIPQQLQFLFLPDKMVEQLQGSPDSVVFLPLRELPTRATELASEAGGGARVVVSCADVTSAMQPGTVVASALEEMVRSVEGSMEGSVKGSPVVEEDLCLVPGVVLVGARACLAGRFPLKG